MFVPEVRLESYKEFRKIALDSKVVVYTIAHDSSNRLDSLQVQCLKDDIVFTYKIYHWNLEEKTEKDWDERSKSGFRNLEKLYKSVIEELKPLKGRFVSCVIVAEEYH